MSYPTWGYCAPADVHVEGLWRAVDTELDIPRTVAIVARAYTAWPHDDFWANLERITQWTTGHPYAPRIFRDQPRTAGLYTFDLNRIDLNNDQYLTDPEGVLFHEFGHMIQDFYRLGTWTDKIGKEVWEAQCAVAGTDSLEEFASNCGRVFKRRLGVQPGEVVPKGFERFLEWLFQVRA